MIFISYSWADTYFARVLERKLLDLGVRLWIDYKSIRSDQPIEHQIVHGIACSYGVVFIDSIKARSSRWVRLERELAQHYRKPCIEWLVGSGQIESIPQGLARLRV